jgi:hypothetical protein
MGGFTFAQGLLILIVTASMLAVSTANKGWQFGFNNNWPYKGGHHQPKYRQAPNKIIVGGSEGWRFGFSYTNWALKNGPIYINDTLGELTFLIYVRLCESLKYYYSLLLCMRYIYKFVFDDNIYIYIYGGCSFQVCSTNNRQYHDSSQRILATKLSELLNVQLNWSADVGQRDTRRKPHYFACGQHDGVHCDLGKMKFFVMPMLRWFR